MELGAFLKMRLIENFTSPSGGREVTSSGKTFGNPHTTGISETLALSPNSMVRIKRNYFFLREYEIDHLNRTLQRCSHHFLEIRFTGR